MRWFISVLFLFLCRCALTQDFNYRHFTIADGLPSSTIYSTTEDSTGFIWFGTDNGLVRFDGYHYKQFTTADGLPDNEVLHIWHDSKNRIWISCYNSPICYLQNNIIYNSKNSELLKSIPKSFVYDGFFESSDGTVCISGVSNTILVKKDTIILLDLPGTRDGNPLSNFVEVNQKIYLLNSGAFYSTDVNPVKIVSEIKQYDSLVVFNKNEIFGKKVYLFNHSRLIVENIFDLPQTYKVNRKIKFYAGVSAICKYNDTTYAVATDNGFVFTDLQLNVQSPVYLKGKNISNLYLNRNGDLWISTTGDGVYFIPFNKCISFDFSNEIESGSITSISAINETTIAAGSEKGQIYLLENNHLKQKLPALTLENNYRKILNIHPVSDWLFVCASSGFYKIQMNNQLQKLRTSAIIKSVSWFGDTLFSGTSAEGSFLNNQFDHGDTIFRNRIIASQFDHIGNIWFATLDSLYTYQNGKLKQADWYDLEKHSRISAINFLKNGAMVLATYNNGILIRNRNKLISVSTADNLASNLCRNLFIDAEDHILICTTNGLSEVGFDTSANKINWVRNYSKTDGLLSNSTYAVFVSGEIAYVGTNAGISLIDIHSADRHLAIPVAITAFNGKSFSIPDKNHPLQFNYDQNDIHLEYTGISFNRDEPLFFTYRLKGSNQDWDTSFQNGINYSNLSPGEYTFEVFAHDGRGNKSACPASVSFVINAAFWQTIYFKLFLLLTTIALIYFIINYRLSHLRKKEQAKHAVEMQINELKLSAIRAQMNPHFIFNALNSIQHFNIVHDFDSAQRYLSDFSKLVRKTLDFSTQNFVRLADEIDYLDNYLSLEQLRFENRFGYSIIKSDEVPSEIEIPSQIIQPYVENAILHGIKHLQNEKGNLKIQFYIADKSLFCVIDDNGIGIHASQKMNAPRKHISKGLNLSKSRIQAMNELYHLHISISIDDKQDAQTGAHGTKVIIRIPLKSKSK